LEGGLGEMTTKWSMVQRTPQTLPNRRFVVDEKNRLVAEFGVFGHSGPQGLKMMVEKDLLLLITKFQGIIKITTLIFFVTVEFPVKNCSNCIAQYLHAS